MSNRNMEIMLLILLLFLIMPGSSHGQCLNISTAIQENQRILVNLLAKNTPLHDGFYSASVGNKSHQVFGVFQCKANISSHECASCVNSSASSYIRSFECPIAEIVSSLCTAKVSNKNIIGVLSGTTVAGFGTQRLDDPLVFSKGFSMMRDLASTVPYQPLMYQAAQVDVGVNGERYGLAQCGRDLSRLDCRNCLEDRLERYRSLVENRTGWEILGPDCSMWYSNVSDAYNPRGNNSSVIAPTPSTLPSEPPQVIPRTPTSVPSGAQRCHGGITIGTIIKISTLTILLLATQVLHLS